MEKLILVKNAQAENEIQEIIFQKNKNMPCVTLKTIFWNFK